MYANGWTLVIFLTKKECKCLNGWYWYTLFIQLCAVTSGCNAEMYGLESHPHRHWKAYNAYTSHNTSTSDITPYITKHFVPCPHSKCNLAWLVTCFCNNNNNT